MKPILSFVLAAAAITLSAPASAQFAKPEDAVKYRKNALFVMAAAFRSHRRHGHGQGAIRCQSRRRECRRRGFHGQIAVGSFRAGNRHGDTKALPEIWKDPAKFKAAADKMQAEIVKLAAAAKTGNLANLKAAFGPVGDTCKACHDDFRAK